METLFEIDRSDELGRFLVAKVDIPPRSLLIREKPLAAAPADDDRGSPGDRDEGQFPGQVAQESAENELYPYPDPDSTSPRDRQMRIPMCLGCFTRMTEFPENRCSQCGWPVCHQRCSQLPHHSENECKLFTSNRTPYLPPHTWPVLYKSILVLRAYLLKFPEFSLKLNISPEKDNGGKSESDSDYTELMKFEDHRDLRWKNPDLVKSDGMILDNIKYFFKNNSNNNNNDNDSIIRGDYEICEDEILKISGIINVNAFTTLKEIEKNKVAIIQCLFKVSTLVSHSCCPNSTWFIGNAPFFRMSIHSAVLIKKGEMLTIPYSARENQYGTLQRLVSTEDVAHFTCGCHRCLDPTELGTMVSAVKCCSSSNSNNNNTSAPCPGYLLPANPTDTSSVWKCTNQPNCQFSTPVQNIVRILCRVEAQLEKIKLNYERNQSENENGGETRLIQQNSQFLAESEALKRKCDEILHPNHYLIQEICMTIVKKEATTAGISNLAGEQLSNFIKHSRFLLEIANVTGPGYCRHRAILQFYLSRGLHREAMEAVEDLENEKDISEKEEEKGENCDIKCAGIDLDLKHEKMVNSDGNIGSDRLVSGSGINSKCYKILNIYKSIDEFEKESFLFFQMEDANNNSSDEDKEVQQVDFDVDAVETPAKINSSSVYLKKLAEQMELTKRRIDKFQNLVTSKLVIPA